MVALELRSFVGVGSSILSLKWLKI